LVQNISGEMLPHKIQPGENSTGSGMDGILYNLGSVWVNDNGNRNYPYLNCNDDQRKLNLNWNGDDNHWNDTCRFLALRKSFYSLRYFGEFIFLENLTSRRSYCQFQIEGETALRIFYCLRLSFPKVALRKILINQI